jgi:molybdopterin-guanine dinucleotide biosynthesis protein A
MGSDKASVAVAGVTMLERVSTALGAVFPRVVVLGGERAGMDSWPDQAPGRGPLAGIASALARMEEERVLVVAVDQPFVRAGTLAALAAIDSPLAVVPVDSTGVRQVTCAVYPKSIGEAALEEAQADGSIQSLLDRVSFEAVTPETWATWGEDGRSWFSADSVAAVEEGVRRYL